MSTTEPSWDLFGAFLAVMRGGSLSSAARALGVAQPTVRRQVEALESALGVVLFTRATNGLVPTDAARATLPYAEAMASTAKALVRSVSGAADEERGTVRVTTSEVVGVEVVPPMLASLLGAHPQLSIELAPSNRTQDLLRRDADVAVRMTAPTQSGLVQRRIGEIPLGLFASEAYLAARGVPTKKTLAKEHALVGLDRERGLIEALAAHGIDTTPRDYALRTDSDVAQLAAIRAGVGVGVCQLPLARGPVPLVRVVPELTFSLGVWVVMHEDLRAARRVRLVFDHLVEQLTAYVEGATPARADRAKKQARGVERRGRRG